MTATLDPAGVRLYRRLRADHVPAAHAFRTARHAADVRRFELDHVTPADDSAALHITRPGDPLTYRFTSEVDLDVGRPEDNGDCYDDDDVRAWEQDRWHYWLLEVEVTDGTDTGTAVLGCVDAGDYWQSQCGLDTEQQLLSVVAFYGLLDEARADLEHARARRHADALEDYRLAEIAS